jgi:hypothetical protein
MDVGKQLGKIFKRGETNMRTGSMRSKISLLFVAFALLLALPAVALASSVDVAVVDVTVPTNSVTLEPGRSGDINFTMSVTGKQEGTATFEINRDWTLNSSGVFVGSNPQEFTVAPRSSGDPANVFTTTGTVSVPSSAADGTYTLTAGVFDITNTNTTGAKLSAGDSGSYSVTVQAPAAPADSTGPTITLTTPANTATYLVNQQVLADYGCSDPAGVKTCVGTVANGAAIDTGSVSSKSFTVNATDNLNNASTLTHNYNVRRYDFLGFSSPVDNNGVFNVAKAGQAIPLKWRLMDGGIPVTNLSSVTVTAKDQGCSLGTTTDQVEEYASGSSGLQNLGDGYYQFNWKSPTTYAKSCKTLTVNGLGVQSQANFQFTK